MVRIKGKMENKQKIMLAAVVLVLGVVVWQVYGMFSSGSTPAPEESAAAPVQQMTAAAPTAANPAPQQGQMPGQPPAAHPNAPMQAVPAGAQPLQEANLQKQSEFLIAQQKNQEVYVDQLNQLQLLKIEREKEEQKQAIASAKLATITAEKNISDIIVRPATPLIPASAYGTKVDSTGIAPGAIQTQPTPPPITAEPEEAQYVVISVAMQLNKWTAVLGYKGELYTVSIGDILPVDGSVVASISKSGVVLKRDGQSRKISLLTSL